MKATAPLLNILHNFLLGKNMAIKKSQTFRKRLPLGTFCDVTLRMNQEWAKEDSSMIDAERKDILFETTDGLKIRSAGYDWLQSHQSKNNFMKVPGSSVKTFLQDVSTVYAVPSSYPSELSLKELAKLRIKTRFDVSKFKTFDECMKTRLACHLVEQKGSEFYCDCHEGIKSRLCKHSVAMMYKMGVIEIDDHVRSKPIGQKRRRGRPKRLPACLSHSPEPRTASNIPTATYHPSPDVSLVLQSPVPSPDPVLTTPTTPPSAPSSAPASASFSPAASPITSPAASSSPVTSSPIAAMAMVSPEPVKRKRRYNVDLPPAKRISRRKQSAPKTKPKSISTPVVKVVKLTICNEAESIVDNLCKVRKSKRNIK